MASTWPTAPVRATPTEYWSSSAETSWASSWAGGSPDEPASKRHSGGADADEKGAHSGGASSFNRFGSINKAITRQAIERIRELGVTLPQPPDEGGGREDNVAEPMSGLVLRDSDSNAAAAATVEDSASQVAKAKAQSAWPVTSGTAAVHATPTDYWSETHTCS